MLAEERQSQILAVARAEGAIDVGALSASLSVAPETIRRDLRLLEQRGYINAVGHAPGPGQPVLYGTTPAFRLLVGTCVPFGLFFTAAGVALGCSPRLE